MNTASESSATVAAVRATVAVRVSLSSISTWVLDRVPAATRTGSCVPNATVTVSSAGSASSFARTVMAADVAPEANTNCPSEFSPVIV